MKFIKKYKKEILIFLTSFIIYFLLGLVITYYLGTSKFWNVLFDMDCPRVLGDLTSRAYNHSRVSVHPLFVILFQPLVRIINLSINDFSLTIPLIQSIITATSAVIVYKILEKITKKQSLINILIIAFIFNYAQLIFSSSIETYVYAQLFLVLLWYYAIHKVDKPMNFNDMIILILLGIGSIAVTITNFIQFIIVIFFIVFLNKKVDQRFLKSLFIISCSVICSVFLADLQNLVWPTAPNFFNTMLYDIFHGAKAESIYITYDISFKKIINVLNSNFADTFNLFKLTIPKTGVYMIFTNSIYETIISIIMAILFYGLNIYYIVKEKINLKKNKIYYAMLLTYIFNFTLHLFYGNNIAFLYMTHYNFLIILLTAYVLNKLYNLKDRKIVFGIIFFIIICSLRSIYISIKTLYPLYNPIENVRALPIIIISISMILIVLLTLNKKKVFALLTILIIIISSLMGYKILNTKPVQTNCDEYCAYSNKLRIYINQLKEMKNTHMIRTYSDRDEKLQIFFFGLADRRKVVYKKGKLIDLKTQEVLRKYEYEDELIIPNEYTVLLKQKDGNLIKIYENEEGVFIDDNNKVETFSKGNLKINLPEFKDHEFSEVLKVLHQEILFNIDGSVPKPNLFGYTTPWYRDGMLGTMVLEYTNNTSLLVPWLQKETKIYDNSRSEDIDETDNLGELLYMIGATGVKRDDLVKKIIREIERLKSSDGTIEGNVDGLVQKYYPTVLALYGAKKVGINLDLTPPKYDDGYAMLTWYSDRISTSEPFDSRIYPYLSWASYHYKQYGTVYILDEIYPLSYEGGDTTTPGKIKNECFVSKYYCEKNLYLSHMWTASEIFLLLIDN